MSTLLLRLSAPMQSWGSSCKFESRKTGREPTKSGVIGMIASAMGIERTAPVDDFNKLRFGVRIDQVGELIRDYHTVHHPYDNKRSYITERYYLADATFLVGLEGDETTLKNIDFALNNPMFPLFLGRRSCPPANKLSLGLRDSNLMKSLNDEPWIASEWYRKKSDPELYLEIIHDANSDDIVTMEERDTPISFSQIHRRYGTRNVTHVINGVYISNPDSRRQRSIVSTEHDAILELKNNRGD
ncbi:MAG: type I-E CRISPR-associated protein Cas5/CasD [Candidatus Methanomethylophilaceae archaeon]|nr:type I-E CRISPR-associated protein Cas5/CasD [Candidatus Cloacimonadota bacterium]MCK9322340.1 type I-E CRISPR-associated protein Cas5/CasD [Candidatus Methanomethylophilaceae archaeon]